MEKERKKETSAFIEALCVPLVSGSGSAEALQRFFLPQLRSHSVHTQPGLLLLRLQRISIKMLRSQKAGELHLGRQIVYRVSEGKINETLWLGGDRTVPKGPKVRGPIPTLALRWYLAMQVVWVSWELCLIPRDAPRSFLELRE